MKIQNLILFLSFPLWLCGQSSKVGETTPQLEVMARKWVKNKPNQPWQSFPTIIVDSLKGYSGSASNAVNVYGSSLEQRDEATGFFRTQKIGGRWWMIDPQGYIHYHRAVNSFREGTSENQKEHFRRNFRTQDEWVATSARLFRSLGFYSTGSWSNDQMIRKHNLESSEKLSYATNLNFMSSYGKKRGGTYQLPGNTGYPNQCIFVFDPEFETFCDEHARKNLSEKNDPNLIGYFSDNELPFGLKNLEGYLTLPNPNDPGRRSAESWLQQKGLSKDQITDTERAEFAGIVAAKYYSTIVAALKKHDPNHLYLGSRLHGAAKFIKPIIEAAGKYCDIISINYYGVWTPDEESLANWAAWGDKPFWITEFYTKAMDSGLANTTGAGFTVETQRDRGFAYQNFCLALLRSRNCVGWDWFRYQDNDPAGKGADPSNLDSNKGLINSEYEPYEALTVQMRQLNTQIYDLIKYFDANDKGGKNDE